MCTTEDCDFNWHTSDCTEPLSFICEVQLECPEGWVIFENSCYKLEKQKASDVPGAVSHCMGEYNSDLMVPNTNEEALFLTDYLTSLSVSELDTIIIVVINVEILSQNSELWNQLDLKKMLIGAKQSEHTTFLEYLDGTLMTNGTFKGVSDYWFDQGYQTSKKVYSMSLNTSGGISQGQANIICEKKLMDEKVYCLTTDNLKSTLTVDETSTIEIWRQTPQKCIEYCRGMKWLTNSSRFAIVWEDKCECGMGPFNPGHEDKLLMCDRNDWRALQGSSDDVSTVAIYNINYRNTNNQHLAPDSCWTFSHQFMYTIDDGLRWLNLHYSPGKPVLNHVDCSYPSPFCEKPLLTKKSKDVEFSGNILMNGNKMPYKQSFDGNRAYLYIGYSKSIMSPYGLTTIEPSYGFKITFSNPKLMTGVWWSANEKSYYYGYITRIGKVEIEANNIIHAGNFLDDHFRHFDGGSLESGATIIRFINPIYADKIFFSEIHFQTESNSPSSFKYINFNFEVYGCDDYDMDTILCPEGWFSNRGDCIKTIEQNSTMTYDEAKKTCINIGGKILEPSSHVIVQDVAFLMKSILDTKRSYWIGVHHGMNQLRNKEMWQFESGIPIYDFQFSFWDSET